MGNYVIGVGNYMIATPSELGNYEIADTPLAWPLDAEALEDLRWYLEDYLLAPSSAYT
jgi:hypothetical protein